MGISANQARMLTLTGRKCDLEAQMQTILNNKLRIAEETAKIAQDYNDSISNRKLFVFTPSRDDGDSFYKSLNASNLYNQTSYLITKVELDGTFSQITATDLNKISIEEGLRTGEFLMVKEADIQTQDPIENLVFDANYADGTLFSGSTPVPDASSWEVIDWRSSTHIMDQLDDSDDVQAQCDYEAAMSELNVKETKLDLEMNQIETEHSSISNEIESVNKIIQKNVEDSYKYFG